LGAPWIEGKKLAARLNGLAIPGVAFKDTSFTPVSIPGMSENPKFKDQLCSGVRVLVTDRNQLRAYPAGIKVINAIQNLYPDSLQFRASHMDRLCGTSAVREAILRHADMDSLINSWQDSLKQFEETCSKYLMYD
ncbi:MAG: DUF1343 domain-containing protein, partial [Calditrichia bacterium]